MLDMYADQSRSLWPPHPATKALLFWETSSMLIDLSLFNFLDVTISNKTADKALAFFAQQPYHRMILFSMLNSIKTQIKFCWPYLQTASIMFINLSSEVLVLTRFIFYQIQYIPKHFVDDLCFFFVCRSLGPVDSTHIFKGSLHCSMRNNREL